MNEVVMLRDAEPRNILQTFIEKKTPAIMSYLSGGKWRVAKVIPTCLGANGFDVELMDPFCIGSPDVASVSPGKRDAALQKKRKAPRRKAHPVNIQVNQPVGVSLKYEYGRFIFETKVVGLEPSPQGTSGGKIVLAVPDRIEIVQRRSYYRVNVPKTLKVDVMLWHRCHADGERRVAPSRYWRGKLVDISAGGAQIAVDAVQSPDFKKGQFVGLRFTPMPYEMPLMFDARIRSILPTANGKGICLGVQIVGLEASLEGRDILRRLCDVVERYYQINQSGVKQMDCQQISS